MKDNHKPGMVKNEILELVYKDHEQAYNWLSLYDKREIELPHSKKMHMAYINITDALFKHVINFFIEKQKAKEPNNQLFGVLNKNGANGGLYSIISSIQYYEKVEEQAAKLFYSMIKNHLFNDGNKRIACWVLQWYLSAYGLQDCLSAEVLLILAIMVAQSPAEDGDLIYNMLVNVFMNQSIHRHAMDGHDCIKIAKAVCARAAGASS